jgi:hypothetical protein
LGIGEERSFAQRVLSSCINDGGRGVLPGEGVHHPLDKPPHHPFLRGAEEPVRTDTSVVWSDTVEDVV